MTTDPQINETYKDTTEKSAAQTAGGYNEGLRGPNSFRLDMDGRKDNERPASKMSGQSKYSAVVFTVPVEPPSQEKNQAQPQGKSSAEQEKEDSDDEDYEDDFEDDFEPYETSNEEEKTDKSRSNQTQSNNRQQPVQHRDDGRNQHAAVNIEIQRDSANSKRGGQSRLQNQDIQAATVNSITSAAGAHLDEEKDTVANLRQDRPNVKNL